MNGVYIIDADNTLWDTYSVFAGAYREMVECLQEQGHTMPKGFGMPTIQTVDTYLARTLADYEYDFALMASALIHVSRGTEPLQAGTKVLTQDPLRGDEATARRAADRFYDYHNKNHPPLYDGTAEALKALRNLNNVLILHSEGREDRVRTHLAVHNLAHYFDYELIQRKSVESFRRARQAGEAIYRWVSDIPSPGCVVIGDSCQRDIVFGNLIGAHTILKPGSFWGPSIPDDPDHRPHHVVTTLEEVLTL